MPRIRAALCALFAAALAATEAGASAAAPRHLLLQAREGHGAPKGPKFFTEDAVHQANTPDHSVVAPKKACHPTCAWACEKQECGNKCRPICQPPKCVTACQKPILSACQQVCQDPHCAVVCPEECSNGQCPECKTVCGEPNCHLDCGQARKCETKCADPVCTYECTADTSPEDCPEPVCNMKCETPTFCNFERDGPTLREVYDGKHADPSESQVQELKLMGKDLAWTGLAKVPVEDLGKLVPAAPVGAAAVGGSLPVSGAAAMGGSLCPGCGKDVDCGCQETEPKVDMKSVDWVERDGPTAHPYAMFK